MGKLFILGLILIHFLYHGNAHGLDPQDQKAVEETQQFLRNNAQRDEWVRKNERAKDADAKAEALVGAQGKEQMYDVAAELTQTIANEAKGDPEKMQKLLLEAQSNPQAFYNKYFTDAQKAKVRGMASQVKPAAPQGPK